MCKLFNALVAERGHVVFALIIQQSLVVTKTDPRGIQRPDPRHVNPNNPTDPGTLHVIC